MIEQTWPILFFQMFFAARLTYFRFLLFTEREWTTRKKKRIQKLLLSSASKTVEIIPHSGGGAKKSYRTA